MNNEYNPMTRKAMQEQAEKNGGYITGDVEVELSDMIGNDLEGVLDILSQKLTGSTLLMDTNYSVVGRGSADSIVILKVTGDASAILEENDDDADE